MAAVEDEDVGIGGKDAAADAAADAAEERALRMEDRRWLRPEDAAAAAARRREEERDRARQPPAWRTRAGQKATKAQVDDKKRALRKRVGKEGVPLLLLALFVLLL